MCGDGCGILVRLLCDSPPVLLKRNGCFAISLGETCLPLYSPILSKGVDQRQLQAMKPFDTCSARVSRLLAHNCHEPFALAAIFIFRYVFLLVPSLGFYKNMFLWHRIFTCCPRHAPPAPSPKTLPRLRGLRWDNVAPAAFPTWLLRTGLGQRARKGRVTCR